MNTDQDYPNNIYTCPAHPELTGNKSDKCYKCGAKLIHVNKEKGHLSEIKLIYEPQNVEAGIPTKICIAVAKQGKNVSLELIHGIKIHFLIVNEELSWFNHAHPKEEKDGTYHISETFPAPGKYLLFANYKPIGGNYEVSLQSIEVSGIITSQLKNTDTKLLSTVNGYTISLLNGNKLTTNNIQDLQFSVVKNGRVLREKDMQPYLGATAYIVMINKSNYDFLHIHPLSDSRFPIYAETNIKDIGLYRMWVQFKIHDMMHVADFTVSVSEGKNLEMNHQKAHH